MPRLIQRASVTPILIAVASLLAACAAPLPRANTPTMRSAPAPSPALPSPVQASPPVNSSDHFRAVGYADLPGWASDDLREAWPALLASCSVLAARPGWGDACAGASSVNSTDPLAVRRFFEARFIPHQVRNQDGSLSGTVTGYYEPLLRGSRQRGGAFQTPLHRVPADLVTVDLGSLHPELKNMRLRGRLVGNRVVPYFSRAELEQQNRLAGEELLWVDDPVDAFFLQVQGSGRVQLEEGKEVVRVAYADQNGHPYRSIGRYLVERGELTLEQASMQGIKAWAAANPARLRELLNVNPGYVFFREEKISDPARGPKGALGVPLTPRRSIAVDPQFIPLGAPVFLATSLPNSSEPLRRLMLAQDVGSAIRNPVRADFFWGFGHEAGELAGRMKQQGQMWVLLPAALTVSAR